MARHLFHELLRHPTRFSTAFLVLLALAACDSPVPAPAPTPTPAPSSIVFVDVAPAAGLLHPVMCGSADKDYLIDTNGTGAAVLDFDGDGLMDLYVVHGSTIDKWRAGDTPNRLYRNLGNDRFEEVGAAAGVDDRGWGAGALAWDYDNDGDADLYVTNYGPNRLYRNDGGVFVEVAAEVGLLDEGWSMGPAAADYDQDGDLDLYVAHYFDFDIEDPPGHTGQGGDRECKWFEADVACGPIGFDPEPDHLYRNDGGNFVDVSVEAGITDAVPGYGMGVLWIDLDGDGWLDVYVVNDASPNLVYRNLGNGKFDEIGAWAGLALGDSGVPMSGMGAAAADTDGNGTVEIFVTNYSSQSNSLYHLVGSGMYEDYAALAGLVDVSFRLLGWGVTFFDVEGDGDLDLMVANGHVYPQVDEVDPTTSYNQRDQLLINDGGGGFDEWRPPEGSPLARETSGRGVVRVDYDNDGDSDILIVLMDEAPELLRNDTPQQGHWIGINLEGTSGAKNAAGARIRVITRSKSMEQVLRYGSSYMSSEDPRLLFAVGESEEATVEVEWPGRLTETWNELAAGRYHLLIEGSATH